MIEPEQGVGRGATRSVEAPAAAGAGEKRDSLACVLLAGGVRRSPLLRSAGASVLDLHLTRERSVLSLWLDRLAELRSAAPGALRNLDVRVRHDGLAPRPVAETPGFHVRFDRDGAAYRGPAGAARDVCAQMPRGATVLVAEAARCAGVSLAPLLRAHESSGADVTVGANPDGSPAGVYVLRREALDLAPTVGFVDLKEQWLSSAVREGLDVRTFQLAEPGTTPLRTREQFLRAARMLASSDDPVGLLEEPPITVGPPEGSDRWAVIARGARVSRRALVADSVVMPGAQVDPGAVVVRSLVCPGGRVGRGEELIDAVVAGGSSADSKNSAGRWT